MADIDITDARRTRAIAILLTRAAHDLGIPFDAAAGGLRDCCARVLAAAQHGGLDPRTYRGVFWIWRRAHG
jgi:hypothetical protein